MPVSLCDLVTPDEMASGFKVESLSENQLCLVTVDVNSEYHYFCFGYYYLRLSRTYLNPHRCLNLGFFIYIFIFISYSLFELYSADVSYAL